MTLSGLLDTIDFSQPMRLQTKRGLRLLRKASPTKEFWEIYRSDKEVFSSELRKLGIQVSEFRGNWELSWWSKDDLSFPPIHDFSISEQNDEPIVYDMPPLFLSRQPV